MKKKFAFLFLFVVTIISTLAQSTEQNKYWYYRYRLRHKFLKAGLTDYSCKDINQTNFISGFSTPAEMIRYSTIKPSENDRLVWGDATADLGWYIGILATEWKLLKNASAPTDSTEQELYYALKAYERLDYHGERNLYPYKIDGCVLNGFFGRDDVTKSFATKYFNNTYYSSSFIDRGDGGSTAQAEIISKNGGEGAHASLDQVVSLMAGMALVVKSLDNNTNYRGYNLKDAAKHYTDLMMGYMANNNYTQPIPYTPYFADHSEDIKFQSYGAAKAAQRVIGDDWGGDAFESSKFENNTTNNYYGLWQEFGTTVGERVIAAYEGYRMGLVLHLAAIGHSWRYGFVPLKKTDCIKAFPYPCGDYFNFFGKWCFREICLTRWCYPKPQDIPLVGIDIATLGLPALSPFSGICTPFELPTIAFNTTALMLSHYGQAFNVGYFPLLHQYLHNAPNLMTNNYYEKKFASAPCEGPFRFEDGTGVEGWRSSNIWTNNVTAQHGFEKGETESRGSGQYSGMDYMLAYNLYKLVKKDEVFTNYLTRNITGSYPKEFETSTGFPPIRLKVDKGSDKNPVSIWAYESVVVDSKISTSSDPRKNGNVAIWAGDEIVFGENFEVEQGASFTAEIRAINCSGVSSPLPSSTPINQRQARMKKQESPDSYINEVKADWNNQINEAKANYNQSKKEGYQSLENYVSEAEAEYIEEVATLYPNPVMRYAQVSLSLDHSQRVSIGIYDLLGRLIATPIINELYSGSNNLINLDLMDLPVGTYIYEIKFGDKIIKKDKLIKQL